MRILKLRFKNLNSLYGEWSIDFTDPAYSDGIFAITGPTGAGKSTILDAICLALYGQTPRLEKITQSTNEIMTRHTGECFAEVEFETSKGHFQCHWSQHRANKKSGGKLQIPVHEITNAGTKKIIETKLRLVPENVENATGMDFKRFTRSMLLAQGSFAVFLQASPNERANLLEQITGTDIYTQISIKVHERNRDEKNELEKQETMLDGIQILSDDEKKELEIEKDNKVNEERTFSKKADELRKVIIWHKNIAALEQALVEIKDNQEKFKIKEKDAFVYLAKLGLAKKVQALEPEYATLKAVCEQLDKEQKELKQSRKDLPELKNQFDDAKKAVIDADQKLKDVKIEQGRETRLIKQVRELDIKIKSACSGLDTTQKKHDEQFENKKSQEKEIIKINDDIKVISTDLEKKNTYLQANEHDKELTEKMTGIIQEFKNFKNQGHECNEKKIELDKAKIAVSDAEKTTKIRNNELAKAETKLVKDEKSLKQRQNELLKILENQEFSTWQEEKTEFTIRHGRLVSLNEIAGQIEKSVKDIKSNENQMEILKNNKEKFSSDEINLNKEKNLIEQLVEQQEKTLLVLTKVSNLEEERRQLADNVPCPLCGATDHPYARGNAPQMGRAQKDFELRKQNLKKVGDKLTSVKTSLARVQAELNQAFLNQNKTKNQLKADEKIFEENFIKLSLDVEAKDRFQAVRDAIKIYNKNLDKCNKVISKAKPKQEPLKNLEDKLKIFQMSLPSLEQEANLAMQAFTTARQNQDRLERELDEYNKKLDKTRKDIEQSILKFGAFKITQENAGEILDKLTQQRDNYIKNLEEKQALESNKKNLESDLKSRQNLLKKLNEDLAKIFKELDNQTAKYKEFTGNRHNLYENKNPDKEEKRVNQAILDAEKKREHTNNKRHGIDVELNSLNNQIEKLDKSTKELTRQLDGLNSDFKAKLADVGFASEELFLKARLSKNQIEELENLEKILRDEKIRLETLFKDNAKTLEHEQNKKLTDKALEVLEQENEQISAKLKDMQQTIGVISEKLNNHQEQLKNRKSQVKAINAQKTECKRWDELHNLIGSADGKKFRNFAQGLTFEIMVAKANQQLQKMSDRYILIRDDKEPLELNVIDNYQAGEKRSTKNLSGGESFIISLALALGLSTMASRNASVDSLFLDEGFGTLDEEALETALDTLSNLHQHGKLIGIISHVPAIKDRISCQIQINPLPGGHGALSGPGCIFK